MILFCSKWIHIKLTPHEKVLKSSLLFIIITRSALDKITCDESTVMVEKGTLWIKLPVMTELKFMTSRFV